ncbi:hypothetical protein ABK040_000526 [Willaertia magna]
MSSPKYKKQKQKDKEEEEENLPPSDEDREQESSQEDINEDSDEDIHTKKFKEIYKKSKNKSTKKVNNKNNNNEEEQDEQDEEINNKQNDEDNNNEEEEENNNNEKTKKRRRRTIVRMKDITVDEDQKQLIIENAEELNKTNKRNKNSPNKSFKTNNKQQTNKQTNKQKQKEDNEEEEEEENNNNSAQITTKSSKKKRKPSLAYMTKLNNLLEENIFINNYENNYELNILQNNTNEFNEIIAFQFKIFGLTFTQMQIIERYFIFTELNNLSYKTIKLEEMMNLLSLGYKEINEKECLDLFKYFTFLGNLENKENKNLNEKEINNLKERFKYFEFENESVSYYWRLTFQLWNTLYYHLFLYLDYKNGNNNNINLENNLYYIIYTIIFKKLKQIPGKFISLENLLNNFININTYLDTIYLNNKYFTKLESVHQMNSKLIQSNIFSLFLKDENTINNLPLETQQQLFTIPDYNNLLLNFKNFIKEKPNLAKCRINNKIKTTIDKITNLNEISVSVMNLDHSVLFFQLFKNCNKLMNNLKGVIVEHFEKYVIDKFVEDTDDDSVVVDNNNKEDLDQHRNEEIVRKEEKNDAMEVDQEEKEEEKQSSAVALVSTVVTTETGTATATIDNNNEIIKEQPQQQGSKQLIIEQQQEPNNNVKDIPTTSTTSVEAQQLTTTITKPTTIYNRN